MFIPFCLLREGEMVSTWAGNPEMARDMGNNSCNGGKENMKTIRHTLVFIFFILVISNGLASADESAATEVFDLGQVVVTDKGDESGIITTTNTISVEDLKIQGATNVAQALEFIPGIDIENGKKGQAGMKVRGFNQNGVKILIDGVPAHESYFGSLDLGQISIDSIAQIKIIKGASSVLYGPNTLGGVINIITKKGGKRPYTEITSSFGENSTRNFIVNHGAGIEKFNYWITASHRTTNGFDLSDRFDPANTRTGIGTAFNEDGGLRDLSYFTKNALNSKIGYEYDKNSKIYLSFNYQQNEQGCPTEDSRYWEFSKWNHWHVNLTGQHDFTDILTMKARVYYVDHEDTLEDISWDAAHTTAKKWFEQSTWDDYTLGGEIQAYLDFGDKSLVKLGASYMRDNHVQQDYYDASTRPVVKGWASEGFQTPEEYEIDIYSYGIEDRIKIFDRLTLNAGISLDIHDPVKAYGGVQRDTTRVWNPQAGASFDISHDFSVYASVAKKTRFPQMGELYSNLAGGNKSLKPQKTIAWELGIKKRFSSMVNISLAGFLDNMDDKIVQEKIGGTKQYVNKGESRIQGIEAQMDITTPWNLDMGMSYTYLSSQDRADASSPWLDSEHIPEHKAVFKARYLFDFGLTTAFQAIYTGEQFEYDGSDKITIGDFIVCNAKLIQAIPMSQKFTTRVFLEIKNMFDENYEEGHGPTPGRSFLLGLAVNF